MAVACLNSVNVDMFFTEDHQVYNLFYIYIV